MNDFKYQKKPSNSEEVLNTFKNFDQVLKKHQAIRKSYARVWKIALAASSSLVLLLVFFAYNQKDEKVIENETVFAEVNNQARAHKNEHHAFFAVSQNSESEKIVETPKKTIPKLLLKKKNETIPKFEKKYLKTKPIEEKEQKVVSPRSNGLLNPTIKENTTSWFTVREANAKETRLPTLYISKVELPEKLTQTELTRFPSINAIYKTVAKEVQIINGMAYVTKRDAKKRPKGYKIIGNNFPPNLIRALHKAERNSVLLFKDITIFIPGNGRTNIGDKIIDIDFGYDSKKIRGTSNSDE